MFKLVWLIIQDDKILKWTHMTWQKAVIFNRGFFVVIDPFSRQWRRTYMLTSPNFKMVSSFAIVTNIAVTT